MDPKTPIQKGVRFCVCYKELIPWVMMPLQVVYVDQKTHTKESPGRGVASFGYGSGTLNGHLLVSRPPHFSTSVFHHFLASARRLRLFFWGC